MTFKDCLKNLKSTTYYYLSYPDNKTCYEFNNVASASKYQSTFGGTLTDYFPYKDYGFEDPYAFTEAWKVHNAANDVISYEVDAAGKVIEKEYLNAY